MNLFLFFLSNRALFSTACLINTVEQGWNEDGARLRIGTNNRPLPPFKRDSNYPRYVFVDRCILRILNVEVVLVPRIFEEERLSIVEQEYLREKVNERIRSIAPDKFYP